MPLVNLDKMEKSIAKAHEINPDPDTNPVDSVEKLYDFIDQSIDYFWFLMDQPLDELKGKGYYYPTLQYHEPIASWWREYNDEWGDFLSTKESWNVEYF